MSDVQQHADAAAEAVRQINHGTRVPGDGWQYPGDAYSLVGSLAHMARMLPQAIEQTGALVERGRQAGKLTSDDGAPEAAGVVARLRAKEARDRAAALAAALDALHSALSPIGYRLDEDEEQQ